MRVDPVLQELAGRFDARRFELGRPHARVRLVAEGAEPVDVLLDGRHARLEAASDERPDAELTAGVEVWAALAEDVTGGLDAFRRGRLTIRRDLHLGVGFLLATASGPDGPRLRQVRTAVGTLSVAEAGGGPPAILLHGLGATKVSLLPTLAALAPSHRVVAVDLPGFGDSVKPLRAGYDAPYFARATVALMDALGVRRADLIGNSMGGRVALEVGLRFPARARRLALLAPSLAWLRERPFAPLLRVVPPQLGLLQPTPRAVVERVVGRFVPGASEGWTAAGVDEFMRAYMTPRGRAAFYAAARNIYLEEPSGPDGLWTRLPELAAPALFVWGRRDRLVPIGFARHVREALPAARHLELDCGHVPQLEAPGPTHRAVQRFLAGDESASPDPAADLAA
jgi:pimeloyl-ACP methyl ester carboxylesterase